jgi:hypothetical protein
VFPGWWRRYGSFLLTVAASEPTAPPVSIHSSPLLATAEPTDSWQRQPRL